MTGREIIQQAGLMRRKSREYYSNAFFSATQIDDLLCSEKVSFTCEDDLILIFEEDRNLLRVFFYAENDESIKKIKSNIPAGTKTVVIDIVGRDKEIENKANKLSDAGFCVYSKFLRMVCKQPIMPKSFGVERIDLATQEDVAIINDLLWQEFDPIFAHLPTIAELQKAVEKKQITLIREQKDIAGFAFFEDLSPKSSVLRYFVVNSKYRGQNIGGALLYDKFSKSQSDTVFTLWVGSYNKTQFLYQKFNFRYDGLVDYILTNGG